MQLHLFLHGKGGIGKSQMAASLADYLHRHEIDAWCADCDPANPSFLRIKSLNVHFVDILNSRDQVDSRRFDDMIENALASGAEHAVIDSGSDAYQALATYLAQGGTFEFLRMHGHRPYLHTILAGGGMMGVTMDGFHHLIELIPDAQFVVWLNPLQGPMVHDGMEVTEHPDFQRHKERIKAVIEGPDLTPETFGKDFSNLLARGQTYADASQDPKVSLMAKGRLDRLRIAFDDVLGKALAEINREAEDNGRPPQPKQSVKKRSRARQNVQ